MVRDRSSIPLAAWALTALVALSSTALSAGSRRAPDPPPQAAPATTSAVAPEPAIAHGQRKLRNPDVPVFVDGKEVAVLRYGELPPGVEPIAIASNPHHAVRYFRVSDYLKGLGVDVARVKAVHFADKSDHIASLEGPELRGDVDRFVFDFTATTGGMPQMIWSTVGLKTMLRVDYFYAVDVFVAKTPREIDRRHHCYLDGDDCLPVARFGDADPIKGTRVYVDGKLVASVKRRLLADSAIASKTSDDESVFSTDKFLQSLGVRTAGVRGIRLLSGDAVIASASAAQWGADADRLTFRVVRHAHGKVRANVPADLQAGGGEPGARDREAEVTAIEVFDRKEPRSAPLVALGRVPDPGPAPEGALARAESDEDPQE